MQSSFLLSLSFTDCLLLFLAVLSCLSLSLAVLRYQRSMTLLTAEDRARRIKPHKRTRD